MIKNGYLYAIALFLLTFIYNADILILKLFSTTSRLGVYIIATKIINVFCIFPQAIGTIFFSLKSNNKAIDLNNNLSKIALFKSSFPTFCLFTIILYFVFPELIVIIFGEEYSSTAGVFKFLLPGLIGLFIIKTIYPEFAGQGKVKMFIPIFFYIGVIQVILNIILISQFSIYGSAVSSSITYLILAIILVQKFLKFRKLKLKELIIPSIKEINLLFKNT